MITLPHAVTVAKDFIYLCFHSQDGKKGFISQLQSQIQRSDFMETHDEQNIPESWKWENQTNVNAKKERKGKNKKNKKKTEKNSQEEEKA